MAALPLSILAILLSFHLYAATARAPGPFAPFGRWKPIKDLDDPNVVRIAKFAVTIYNQRVNGRFEYNFVSVIKGDTHIFAGTSYRLLIDARNVEESVSANLLVVVYDQPRGKGFELVSLKIITSGLND